MEGEMEGDRPYSNQTQNITKKIRAVLLSLIPTNCVVRTKRDRSSIECSLSSEEEGREERKEGREGSVREARLYRESKT